MAGIPILPVAEWPPEFAKPRLVVSDDLVELFREAMGDGYEIIPLSDTYLPVKPAGGK